MNISLHLYHKKFLPCNMWKKFPSWHPELQGSLNFLLLGDRSQLARDVSECRGLGETQRSSQQSLQGPSNRPEGNSAPKWEEMVLGRSKLGLCRTRVHFHQVSSSYLWNVGKQKLSLTSVPIAGSESNHSQSHSLWAQSKIMDCKGISQNLCKCKAKQFIPYWSLGLTTVDQ